MVRASFLLIIAGAGVACGGGGGFPDARPPDAAPKGTFSLAWSVVDPNNQPLACERIAAQTMTVLTHNLAFEGGSTQIFNCDTGMGMSEPILTGTYELDFELRGASGLLARAPKQTGIVIEENRNTELAPLTFVVVPAGNVALGLASGKPGGNCGATNAGGAGIEQVSITLQHADSSCEPATLAISAGATRPAGSYTINCAAPPLVGCIEADQVISGANLPSDAYTIHVSGLIGGKVCWANNDGIQVPGAGNTLTRTLNLGPTGVSGCP